MRRSAPLIVGGGPAGSAAAITLAVTGARPVVLERQRETGDALCGGFLSWRTLETLEALGIGETGGHLVGRLRLFAGESVGEARLPYPAIGVSRQRLDSLLLARAETLGAGVERGVTVRDWDNGRIETGDGAVLTPETLFLATGKHDLRGIGRPRDRPEAQTIGIRVRLAPNPALDRLISGTIELHLFDRGYCGLVLQEGGRGNLCLAVRKSRLTEAGGDPDRLLAEWGGESPAFAERLAFREGGSDAVGAIPYGWIAREALPGVFRLGDQGAVIPSLSGEGNGIALASGIMAGRSWLAGESSETFQPRLARATTRPVTIARALWHWAERPNTAQLMARGVRLAPWVAGRFAEWTRIRH
jgi:flavin-dependent dehydrogenase